jgi:hypothetical protein
MRSCRAVYLALAFVLSTLALVGSVGATSSNTDVTDLWWDPAESGWGMQLVNTGTLVFATIYVYGQDGKPTWLTGSLYRTGASPVKFEGDLVVTTGPYFGGAFNSANVTRRVAGRITFVLTGVNTGQLAYSVDGALVSKSVQRQPLMLDDYNGIYVVVTVATYTGCFNPQRNGTFGSAALLEVTQGGASMSVLWGYVDGTVCEHTGSYSQFGHMGRFDATYNCSTGESGTAVYSEMSNRVAIFNARLQGQSPGTGCHVSMLMTALTPEE